MNIILWTLIALAWSAAMIWAYILAVKAYRFAKGPPPEPKTIPRAIVVHLSLGDRLGAHAHPDASAGPLQAGTQQDIVDAARHRQERMRRLEASIYDEQILRRIEREMEG